MTKKIGIYEISLSPGTDTVKFEEVVKTTIFPKMSVGHQTRGGLVTGQCLVKKGLAAQPGQKYWWIVEWTEEGGSPFGSARVPADPAAELGAFGANTSFTVDLVVADEKARG